MLPLPDFSLVASLFLFCVVMLELCNGVTTDCYGCIIVEGYNIQFCFKVFSETCRFQVRYVHLSLSLLDFCTSVKLFPSFLIIRANFSEYIHICCAFCFWLMVVCRCWLCMTVWMNLLPGPCSRGTCINTKNFVIVKGVGWIIKYFDTFTLYMF